MRRLHFSIRDLLWLTLVVAMGTGWFVQQRKSHIREQQLGAEVNRWTWAAAGMEMVLQEDGWSVSRPEDPDSILLIRREDKDGLEHKYRFGLEQGECVCEEELSPILREVPELPGRQK